MKIWQKTDQGAVRKENQDMRCRTAGSIHSGCGVRRYGRCPGRCAGFLLAAGAFLEALRGTLRPGQDITAVAQAGEAAVAKAEPYCL